MSIPTRCKQPRTPAAPNAPIPRVKILEVWGVQFQWRWEPFLPSTYTNICVAAWRPAPYWLAAPSQFQHRVPYLWHPHSNTKSSTITKCFSLGQLPKFLLVDSHPVRWHLSDPILTCGFLHS